MSDAQPFREAPNKKQRGHPGHSGYVRVPFEYYREPAWAVDAPLDNESFLGAIRDPRSAIRDPRSAIRDPFCGGGTVPARCRARGMRADGSDIQGIAGCVVADFFDATSQCDNIISNPPYKLAERAARHALTLVRRKVAFFLRLNFYESQRRDAFFRNVPLARVLVMKRRVSCPPGIYVGERDPWGCLMQREETGGKAAYAWFVFEQGHVGEPCLGRI